MTTVFARDLALRLCKDLSACQRESFGHLITSSHISKITEILIRSKLTVTNKGTYQDT